MRPKIDPATDDPAAMIEKAKTGRGGWTRKQLAEWGVPWPPPKGWRDELTKRLRAEAEAKRKGTE